MGKMKSLLNFFVEIEPDDTEEVPEDAASDDPDVAAKAAKERAEQGPVGKKPKNPKKVGEMAGDPYAGMVDEEALSDATAEIDSQDAAALFDKIYQSAGLAPRGANEFTIHKIERLLQSEHLSGMSDQVKQRSIMVTLESSNKNLEEVIQDAIARDKALDQYDGMLRKDVKQMEKQVKQENARIEKEIQEYLERKKAEIEQNKKQVNQARRMYEKWSGKKESEEERLFEAVSVFVDKENPISQGMGDWEEADPGNMPDVDLLGSSDTDIDHSSSDEQASRKSAGGSEGGDPTAGLGGDGASLDELQSSAGGASQSDGASADDDSDDAEGDALAAEIEAAGAESGGSGEGMSEEELEAQIAALQNEENSSK